MTLLSWLLISVITVSVRGQQRGTCVTSPSAGVLRLGLESHRNNTGHWSYKIGLLKIDENSKSTTSDYWTLDAQNCRDTELSIMNITLTSNSPSSPPSARVARLHPADYKLTPGVGHYKVHPELVTWQRAKEICEEEQAHLVIVETEAEAVALVNLLKTVPKPTAGATYPDYVWTGVYQFGGKGQPWYNLFGERFLTTAKQEDAFLTVENVAGLLHRSNAKLSWSAKTTNEPFVCEQYA